MTEQEAISLLTNSGFDSDSSSLAKLIDSGRISATGSRQRADLDIDEVSLKNYIGKYRELINGNGFDFIRRHTVL